MVIGAHTTNADVRLMSSWEAGVRAGAATQRESDSPGLAVEQRGGRQVTLVSVWY